MPGSSTRTAGRGGRSALQPVERRAVLDNNVVISALVLGSANPRRVLELAFVGKLQLVSSPHILTEFEDVLVRKFRFSAPAAREARVELELIAILADPTWVPQVSRDPDDDHVLAAAVQGRAGWIVTGDQDLLELRAYCGIEILTPAQFVALGADW